MEMEYPKRQTTLKSRPSWLVTVSQGIGAQHLSFPASHDSAAHPKAHSHQVFDTMLRLIMHTLPGFLIVGQRSSIQVGAKIDFTDPQWSEHLLEVWEMLGRRCAPRVTLCIFG